MITPQSAIDDTGRTHWPRIAAAACLLLVSVLTVVNSVGLSRLTQQSHASDQGFHVQALATRVGDLEQQIAVLKRQPPSVTQSDFTAAQQSLKTRLAQVESEQAAVARVADLQALQARVGDVESRLKRTSVAAVTSRRPTEADKPLAEKPHAPDAPFGIAGVELRGGERFLSIASPSAASLRELRLVRVGDAIGGWQLQAIEAHAAVFRVDGQTQRIVLP